MSVDEFLGGRTLPLGAAQMRRVVEWLAASDKNEVTNAELAQIIRPRTEWDHSPVRAVARRLVKHGLLRRLHPGHYEVIRPGRAPRNVTLGDRLDHWMPEHALVYATAMSIHGYGPALTRNEPLHILRRRPVCIRPPDALEAKVQYHFQFDPIADIEVVPHPVLGHARVRTAVATVFDALGFPQHCGGLLHAAGYVGHVLRRTSAEALVKAAANANRRAAVCRLALLLELAGVAPEVLAGLPRHVAGRVYELDPLHQPAGTINTRLRLRVNVPLEPLKAALQ